MPSGPPARARRRPASWPVPSRNGYGRPAASPPRPTEGRCPVASELAGGGLTPNELAKILRVSPDRVRAWIKSGHLGAINTAATRSGKPRFVVLPHHLEEFERGRRVSPPPGPTPRRRKR